MSQSFGDEPLVPFGNGRCVRPTSRINIDKESRLTQYPDMLSSQPLNQNYTQRFNQPPRSGTSNTGFFNYNGCDATINERNQSPEHDRNEKPLGKSRGDRAGTSRKRKAHDLETQLEDVSRHAPRSRQTPPEQVEKDERPKDIAPMRRLTRPDELWLPGIRELLESIRNNLQGDQTGAPAPEYHREPSTQRHASRTSYRIDLYGDVKSDNLARGSYGPYAFSRERGQVRNGHAISQATQNFDSHSTNPSIPLSHNLNHLQTPPEQPSSSPNSASIDARTFVAHRRLEPYMLAGEVPQDRSNHSTEKDGQASAAASLSSYGTNTGSYGYIHYPMNTEQLREIAVAVSMSIQEPQPRPLPSGPPYTKESAPEAPGPPPPAWVQKYYNYFKWNRELGYLRCTSCRLSRSAHDFERIHEHNKRHHELLPTCLDCRRQNKHRNKNFNKKNGRARENQEQTSNEPRTKICWRVERSLGCGKVKKWAALDPPRNYNGFSPRYLCRLCKSIASDPSEHPASRPGAVKAENIDYTTHSFCLECKEFIENENFDLVAFTNVENFEYPKQLCRKHDYPGAPNESVLKKCIKCQREWHSGQFEYQFGKRIETPCYTCLQNNHSQDKPTVAKKPTPLIAI